MAFTVTARHTGNSGATGVQTQATNSVTPTANSLLLVGMSAQNNAHSNAQAWQDPTGGSLTYTQLAEAADVPWNGITNFSHSAAMYRATVGGSPSAFAVTVDAYSGTQTFQYDVRACDVTGHDTSSPVIQSKAASAQKGGGNSETGSLTLDSALTTGALLVVYNGNGADAASTPSTPTVGGQAMTVLSTATGPVTNGGLWYRVVTGAESNAIVSWSDLGDQVGAFTAVALEVAVEPSGPPPNLMTLRPLRSGL